MSTTRSTLIGHHKLLESLNQEIKLGRLGHALLFSGPDGIGKKRVALEVATVLMGFSASEKIHAGNHPDLHVYAPESTHHQYSIDQVREIQKKAECSPYEATCHLFILDESEGLTIQASNAFLKLLEEPPENVYFILITSRPYKLLPTVRSRLQKIVFSPLSSEEFTLLLQNEGVLNLAPYEFMSESSIGRARKLAGYKQDLEALQELLPYPYLEEIHGYQSLFQRWDENKSFDFMEFFPFFEALLREFALGENSKLNWPDTRHEISFISLNQKLKELYEAHLSHIKLSSCLGHFFLNLKP